MSLDRNSSAYCANPIARSQISMSKNIPPGDPTPHDHTKDAGVRSGSSSCEARTRDRSPSRSMPPAATLAPISLRQAGAAQALGVAGEILWALQLHLLAERREAAAGIDLQKPNERSPRLVHPPREGVDRGRVP